jgi:hypothetical protein
LIIETDASNETWVVFLLQKSSARQEEVCVYASGCFSDIESKCPSSHKEILAVKNGIKKFKLFLKPIHFTVRTYLKHMKGMLSNQQLLEQGNNIILRWSLWLDGFDFDTQYKPRKVNYIADLLTREAAPAPQVVREIKMMASSSQLIPTAPIGFKWVLLCDHCRYCYCFDCMEHCIKSNPLCKNILEKWIQANNHCIPNNSYFVQSHRMSRGTITGGPMQGYIYIYIVQA